MALLVFVSAKSWEILTVSYWAIRLDTTKAAVKVTQLAIWWVFPWA